MKPFLILLTLLLASCAPKTEQAVQPAESAAQTQAEAQDVRVADLRAALESGAYLLDVRTQAEFDEGHIDGAKLIPLNELAGRLAEVPADKTVYVICRSGNRSAQASAMLRAAGKDVRNVLGGMNDWVAAGYPVSQ